MNNWKNLEHWDSDDDFRAYLVGTLKLPNSDAILRQLTIGTARGGIIAFAKGTRRLRYEKGIFYLDVYDSINIGTGKHLDIKAIEQHLQKLAGRAKINVKLDKHSRAACSLREWDINGKIGFDIKLNPDRLRGPNQVKEKLSWLEREISG